MEEEVAQLSSSQDSLNEMVKQLESVKAELEEQLQDYTEETSQQVCVLDFKLSEITFNFLPLKIRVLV